MKCFILFALLLSGCATHPHRLTHSDGSFEDLYLCYLYPTGYQHNERSSDLDFALVQTKYRADLNKIKYDYVECFVVN